MSDLPAPVAPSAAQRTAWLLFAPPAVLAGLRWLLQWQGERGPQTTALPLTPLALDATPLQLFSPFLWALGAVLLLGLWMVRVARRAGAQRVRRALLWAWVALWLAGSAALLWRHANRQGMVPLAPVQAEVLGSRTRMPSLHAVGGTELLLRVDGLEAVQQLVVDDPRAAQWQPGQRLALTWARGRSSGRFVTGWGVQDRPAGADAAAPNLR